MNKMWQIAGFTAVMSIVLGVGWVSEVDYMDIYGLVTTKIPAGAPQPSVTCMMTHCTREAFNCFTHRMCLKALACLAPCGNDQACTFHCLSNYETPLLHEFNKCNLHDHGCIELLPPDTKDKCSERETVKELELEELSGQWFIVMGLNAIYDCFPCQIFYFDKDSHSRHLVYMDYQVDTVYGETINKTVVEYIHQIDPSNRGLLLFNGTQNGLYHEEQWRILYMDRQLMIASYCGTMTSWLYEGAVVFSRKPTMEVEEEGRLGKQLRKLRYQEEEFCKPTTVGCSIEKLRV